MIISYYNTQLTSLIVKEECLIFWITLCIVLQGLIDEKGTVSNKELLYIIAFIPFVLTIVTSILKYRNEWYI